MGDGGGPEPPADAGGQSPVCALLVPKTEVAVALRALNSLTPRWGAAVARLERERCKASQVRLGGASRKGIHIPQPQDDSARALRAIELPPPLDRVVIAGAGAGEAEVDDSAGDPQQLPGPLADLLASGAAALDPEFWPPCDLDDLHPCPDADPHECCADRAPLPAQDAEGHAFAADGPPCCGPGPFTFVELFAGIGGFRLGLEALGGRCVFASEMHPTARAVYCENWPTQCGAAAAMCGKLAGDIRLVPVEDVPEHDVLTAGFPCQPFSALGEQTGLQESRGRLFLQVCRVLRGRRPPLALLENVPGLLGTDGGRALEAVARALKESGYRVAHRVYNSQAVLPQKRKRVYIVAIRADLEAACEVFRFPWLPDLGRTLAEALERPPPAEELGHLVVSEDRWGRLQQSRAFHEAPEDILGCLDAPAAPLVASYGQGGSGSFSRYTQLVPPEGAPAGDLSRPRRLSRRECARLQGFPETFSYAACDGPRAWYRLIGNAVSPPIVCALAASLLCALRHAGARRCRLPGTRAALQLALQAGPPEAVDRLLVVEVSRAMDGSDVLSLGALLTQLDSER